MFYVGAFIVRPPLVFCCPPVWSHLPSFANEALSMQQASSHARLMANSASANIASVSTGEQTFSVLKALLRLLP